eukprot:TRINITY_DN7361_c0_g1_i2.p1 TRINITY_DN7361_c0_g1~~TRINITY_DN7361_c0_g1_i2.p1  ORF type:complete len:551 (+),score=76.66 TRINITY_DN7361_c0_g1_i2:46-1698(+)
MESFDLDPKCIPSLKVTELRHHLESLGMPKKGLKRELVERLTSACDQASHKRRRTAEDPPSQNHDRILFANKIHGKCYFDAIPIPVLCEIFCFLDGKAVVAAREVCKSFSSIISKDFCKKWLYPKLDEKYDLKEPLSFSQLLVFRNEQMRKNVHLITWKIGHGHYSLAYQRLMEERPVQHFILWAVCNKSDAPIELVRLAVELHQGGISTDTIVAVFASGNVPAALFIGKLLGVEIRRDHKAYHHFGDNVLGKVRDEELFKLGLSLLSESFSWDRIALCAIRDGNVEGAILLFNICTLEKHRKNVFCTEMLVSAMLRHGSISLLQRLEDLTHLKHPSVALPFSQACGRGGNVECLEYLLQNKFPVCRDILLEALKFGHFAFVDVLLEKETFKLEEDDLVQLCALQNAPAVKYVLSKMSPEVVCGLSNKSAEKTCHHSKGHIYATIKIINMLHRAGLNVSTVTRFIFRTASAESSQILFGQVISMDPKVNDSLREVVNSSGKRHALGEILRNHRIATSKLSEEELLRKFVELCKSKFNNWKSENAEEEYRT